MTQLSYKVFTATIASAASLSNEIDIERGYRSIYVQVPVANVGETELYGSNAKAGTFVPMYNGTTKESILSSVSNVIVKMATQIRYLKIHATTAPGDGGIYKIICFE